MKTRLRRNRKLAGGLGLLLALALILGLSGAVAANGPPAQVARFYGSVTVCTTQAAEGTEVLAKNGAIEVTTTVDGAGNYGNTPDFLDVPGEEGDTVEFWVLGMKVNEAAWAPAFPGGRILVDLVVPVAHLTVTSDGCCEIDVYNIDTATAMGTVAPGATEPFPDIDCGTEIELEALTNGCCDFEGWEVDGAPVGGNPIVVVMNGNRTAIATCLEIGTATLTVEADPPEVGEVTGGGPFDCCTWQPITATSTDPCWYFDSWTGTEIADPDLASTTVHIDGDKTVTANFLRHEYSLTVEANPPEGGEVTGTGGPFDCCTWQPITADPAPGWVFTGWTGTGIAAPGDMATTVHIDADKTVTANFAPPGPMNSLTVDSVGAGEVTIPGEGTYFYPEDTVAPLLAEADPGGLFINWTGETGAIADVNDPSTTILMDDDYSITANFRGDVLMELELGVDWNILSTPVALDPSCIAWGDFTALGDGLDYQIAYYYDGTIFQIVPASYPFMPCDAIYVKMNSADTVPIIPNPDFTMPPSKDVVAGWNLVGSAFLEQFAWGVDEALVSLYYAPGELSWGYTQVISPALNQPDWVYIRDGADPPDMLVGKGVWVSLDNADIYTGFTYTPWTLGAPLP